MHYRLRSFIRVYADAKISVTARDFSLTSTLSNISLGGILLSSEEQVYVGIGDVYKLNIHLSDHADDPCIAVNGMAIRIDEKGIAFRFIETGPDILRQLFSYVYPGAPHLN